MNIGNHGYSSWIHNTSRTGYGYGQSAAQTGKAGTGKAEEKSEEKNMEDMTLREQILAHMEEMAKKVKEGKVEPSFQIGGQTFTIKEWDKLLADFDDAAEGLQEQMKELIAEVEKQAAKEAARRKAEVKGDDNAIDVMVTDLEEIAALLTNEVTKCSYPAEDPKNKHWYITCYGQDGITCKEAYIDIEGDRWVNKDCWSISYTEKGQYEKVMAFLKRFPGETNLRFASHENFWEDFLAGEIDENDFVNFYKTSTKNGVPDYTYEKDGSTYIDREKVKYAKYMNDFGTHFYTAEEMELMQRAIINENRKGLKKISDYDGQMTVPAGTKTGDGEEEDDLKTQIITKPDGSVVLQIETNFGVMEVEVTEAQKFGLQYNAKPGFDPEETRFASPFARGAGAVAAYEAAGL